MKSKETMSDGHYFWDDNISLKPEIIKDDKKSIIDEIVDISIKNNESKTDD